MNIKWMEELYYFLKKDYGSSLTYIKLTKNDINYETGERSLNKNYSSFSCVIIPSRTILTPTTYNEMLSKTLGNNEVSIIKFLVKVEDLPTKFEFDDYLVHDNLRYSDLKFDQFGPIMLITAKAITSALPYGVKVDGVVDNILMEDIR